MSELQLFEVIGGYWVDFIYKVIKPEVKETMRKSKLDQEEWYKALYERFVEYNTAMGKHKNKLFLVTIEGIYKYMRDIKYKFADETFKDFVIKLAKIFFPPNLQKKLKYDVSIKLFGQALFQINNCVIKDLNSSRFWHNLFNCENIKELQNYGSDFTDSYIQMSFVVKQQIIYEIDPPYKSGSKSEVTHDLAKQLNKLKKKYEFLQTQYNEIASTMESLTNENEQMRMQIAKYEEERQSREMQPKPTPVRKFQASQQLQPAQPVQQAQQAQQFTLFNKPSEMVENKPEVKPPKIESESEEDEEDEDDEDDEDDEEENASSSDGSEEKEKEEARNLAMKLLANKKKPTNKFLDDYLEKIN